MRLPACFQYEDCRYTAVAATGLLLMWLSGCLTDSAHPIYWLAAVGLFLLIVGTVVLCVIDMEGTDEPDPYASLREPIYGHSQFATADELDQAGHTYRGEQ